LSLASLTLLLLKRFSIFFKIKKKSLFAGYFELEIRIAQKLEKASADNNNDQDCAGRLQLNLSAPSFGDSKIKTEKIFGIFVASKYRNSKIKE
jgi:hypothetical protein